MIYFAILIPVLTIISLHVFYHEHMAWWENLTQLLIPIGFIILFKFLAIQNLTSDTEYLGSYATEAWYEEQWNEYIHQTCTRTVSCGKNCTTTQVYDCSYVDNHPEQYYLKTGLGVFDINRKQWLSLRDRWNGAEFREMNRNYHSEDGDAYICYWDKKPETIESVTKEHAYENRTQAASSVYNFQNVSKEEISKYGLYQYPAIIGHKQPALLGYKDDSANALLDYMNATMGVIYQVRVYLLVYQDQPENVSLLQEALWQGGNKNELILTVGIDDANRVEWARVLTWCENQEIFTSIRDEIVKQDAFDAYQAVLIIQNAIKTKWKRREFKEFNYLQVEPTGWQIVGCCVLTLMFCVGLAVWHVRNEIDE